MKKTMVLVLCLLMLLCGCSEEIRVETVPTTVATEPVVTTEATEPPTTVPTEPPEEHFTLTFVGDCTLGGAPNQLGSPLGFFQTMGEDYGYPFRNVAEFFENDDFTMINLEGPFTDGGYPAQKMFTFRGPSSYIRILTENSVEAVTLANNHSLDYGQVGYNDTKVLLQDAGIGYVEKDCASLYTTQSGLTIGLYASTFVVDVEDMKAEVAALREMGAEVVVFAVHWGKEGYYYPLSHHVENAHAAIDAGVDVVMGHHPHVLQRMEEYNGGLILYSLGNFSFGGHAQPPDLDSVLVQQEFIRAADGTITRGELTVVPMCCSSAPPMNNYQPTPYEEGTEEYQRVLDKLSGLWDLRRIDVNYG